MMKVRCINPGRFSFLRMNEIYEAVKSCYNGPYYDLIDRNGQKNVGFRKDRFEIIEEINGVEVHPLGKPESVDFVMGFEETPNQAEINNMKDTVNRALCDEKISITVEYHPELKEKHEKEMNDWKESIDHKQKHNKAAIFWGSREV
jgi:hypothetical protein